VTVGRNLQFTTELPQPLSHSQESDPDGRAFLAKRELVVGYAAALVNHLKMNMIGLRPQTNRCGGTSGMTVNIGKTFLDNAENRGLQLCRKPVKVCWQI
jgi:hypothetical protein